MREMSEESRRLDQQIVERYLSQPSRLPAEVRRRAQSVLGGPVRLYALVDLDDELRLTEQWLVLGDENVVSLSPHGRIHRFERGTVRAIRDEPGLSATFLHILGEPGEPPLAELRDTHRQLHTSSAPHG